MTINGITPADLEFVAYNDVVIGDQLINVWRPLKNNADLPTPRQLAHAKSNVIVVDTITPYIPKPGAANANIADSITVINAGVSEAEITAVKTSKIWRVKR